MWRLQTSASKTREHAPEHNANATKKMQVHDMCLSSCLYQMSALVVSKLDETMRVYGAER